MTNLKSFFDYAEDDGSIPDGTYMVKVTAAEVGAWSDSNQDQRLQLRTEVIYGEYNGSFGPRMNFSVPEYRSGQRADGSKWEMKVDDQCRKMANQLAGIFAPNLPALEDPYTFDLRMLENLVDRDMNDIVGQEFYVVIAKNARGYTDIKKVYAITDPPRGFENTDSSFSLDEF